MHFSTRRSPWRLRAAVVLFATLVPAIAEAQYTTPSADPTVGGEKYHVELAGALWNADPTGVVQTHQTAESGLPSKIDLLTDLNFKRTQFRDFRIVLKASRKSKLRIQYTPVDYESEVLFKRQIVFNGITFPISVPIESLLSWHVWRFGYEYDFLSKSRGFVGLLLEGRYTQMEARLTTNTPLLVVQADQDVLRAAPLPAIGVVARGYLAPNVAVHFEVSGLKFPNTIDKRYEANYYDWDIHGIVNVTQHVGVEGGWRRISNFLGVEQDTGDVAFQGLWFGGALRF
jgi:hypothetical protein